MEDGAPGQRSPDDRSVTIREATAQDAAQLVALDRALAVDGRGMVITLEQVPSVEERRHRLEEMERARRAGQGDVTLVADLGHVVGCAELRQLRPARCRHVGLLSLGVHPSHQRRGIGRRLMEALVDRARAAGLVRLELYVRSDNDRARALYRAIGFDHEATRGRFVALDDGSYVDDCCMVRFLG